jgi:hypothetical protein
MACMACIIAVPFVPFVAVNVIRAVVWAGVRVALLVVLAGVVKTIHN